MIFFWCCHATLKKKKNQHKKYPGVAISRFKKKIWGLTRCDSVNLTISKATTNV
jgi:hypothetical protein